MFCAALLIGFVFAGPGFAETLYVKKSGTKLQAEASAKSGVVARLNRGTAVNVLKKAGRFYEVSAGGKKGWVFKFKLTAKAPSSGGGLFDSLGGDNTMAANEASSGSSIRGLSPVSEEHAKKKGISEADIQAVKDMENFRVSPQDVDQFLASRKLGEYGE